MTIAATTLHHTGQLHQRVKTGQRMLRRCVLCPRRCRVDRLAGETGYCGVGALARIASYGPHFGEEQPLVGTDGSGTIFLAGCNLHCCFCQNYAISHAPETGQEVNALDFAAIMLELQAMGCHNINLVTPSHVVPQILAALVPALEGGLQIPLVFNSSGYESSAGLALLAGAIDIYLPDFKFWRSETASRYARASDYPEQARRALLHMYHQVGDLVVNPAGIAQSGLLVRHLLMPGMIDETEAILHFIATQLSTATYVNIMGQYHPCGRADQFDELGRPLNGSEYRQAFEIAKTLGLSRLDRPDVTRLLQRLVP